MTIMEYTRDNNQALTESQGNTAESSKDLQARSLDDMGSSFQGLEEKFDQLQHWMPEESAESFATIWHVSCWNLMHLHLSLAGCIIVETIIN